MSGSTSKKAVRASTAAQTKKLKGLPTTSARIRYLNSLGWSRSEIAVKLDKRYQHVRNVLITPLVSVQEQVDKFNKKKK